MGIRKRFSKITKQLSRLSAITNPSASPSISASHPKHTYTKFSICYAKADGLLFIRNLGSGVFGIASQVQSLSGEMLVRKQTAVWSAATHTPEAHPEIAHYSRHAHIPELHDYVPYGKAPNRKVEAAVDVGPDVTLVLVSKFCNGGDLEGLYRNLYRRQHADSLTESLTWRMLSHALSVVVHLHQSRPLLIVRRDIHKGNVFVDWAEGQALPGFYLGDFGISASYDVGKLDIDGVESEGPNVDALAELSSPQRKHDDWVADTDLKRAQDLRWKMTNDVRNLGRVAEELTLPPEGCEKPQISGKLAAVAESLRSYKFDSLAKHAEFLATLRSTVDEAAKKYEPCLARCIAGADWCAPQVQKVPLWDSRKALLEEAVGVPGPWHVAEVDPDTLEVVDIDEVSPVKGREIW